MALAANASEARPEAAHLRPRRKRLRFRVGQWPLLVLLLPSLLLIVLFSYYPAVRSLEGSFTSWDGFSSPTYVGWQNFSDYFQQPLFRDEVQHLVTLVVLGAIISIFFPFAGAELVRALPKDRIQPLVKYLLVVPMVIPQVVLINVWANLLNPSTGLVNAVLSGLHLPQTQWLSDPHTALLSILLIGFPWVSSLAFLVYLAGLEAIPVELEDAASLDGVVGLARIVHIDVPLTIPQTRFVLVIAGVSIVQNFIPIFLLTNGGPGNATMVPGLDMYESAFQNNEFGYGMAIGTVLFAGMLVATFVVLRLIRPRT
jgi:raffinose/stachyose/melibiose transport system permease protein